MLIILEDEQSSSLQVSMSVISFPIPNFQNLPIQAQNYLPNQFFISNISLGQITTVTTTVNHNYVIGQLVRILIPGDTVSMNETVGPIIKSWGCLGLNNQTGYVISIPADNQVVLNLNSSGINPFINAGTPNQPQIVAVGDINNGQTNSNGRNSQGLFPPGSFINVSF